MTAAWTLSIKPSFLAEWQALPADEGARIFKKIQLLLEDPLPDGKVKKRLTNYEGHLCRLRAGAYRVFYTFEAPFVCVLTVRKRDEQTYADDVKGENLGGLAAEMPPPSHATRWVDQVDVRAPRPQKTNLPAPVSAELLERLGVPAGYRGELVGIATEDDLLNMPGVPDEVLLRVHQALVERPLHEIMAQPDLVTADADDLLRYRNGELLGFLLKLNPEQARFVTWGVNAGGPTLLKGAPGTGKSTVALYRARAMIEALRKGGVTKPRLLFTTYTHALVKFSEQLLESLLGADAKLVEVKTADSVAVGIAGSGGKTVRFADADRLRALLAEALAGAAFQGNSLQKKAQVQAVERLGCDYLLDEIGSVIDARRLRSLEAYLAAKRPGRSTALNKTQREAVWRVREALHAALDRARLKTWQQVRATAADIVEAGGGERYDAVLVDEAQDLEPSALVLLTGLCRAPNRLFLTADANQSIYGAGFRWQDVHENLRFQGRTGVLTANHRSTREIGEAAHAYLIGGVLDGESASRSYVNAGPAPAVRHVQNVAEEAKLLERFFVAAAKEMRLGVGSGAVLVPTEKAGKRVAEALTAAGLPSRYMPGKDLDLKAKALKVLTLKSAKGLEFPAVALAGFGDGAYPWLGPTVSDDERADALARERRTLFVAMTRAMRALLVLVPAGASSPLLEGFAAPLWNIDHG